MTNIIEFDQLQQADFYPGKIYKAGKETSFSSEPLSNLFKLGEDEYGNKLKGLGNQSGIRPSMVMINGKSQDELSFLVLVNRKTESEWPNFFNETSSLLTYFGDNKEPGNDYLNTKQKGNKRFEELFEASYRNCSDRAKTCPIFYFEATSPGARDYQYIGLAYPYVEGRKKSEILKKISVDGIDNLKAIFTIVSDEVISRSWLYDLKAGNKVNSKFQPPSWENYLSANRRNSNELKNEIAEISTGNDYIYRNNERETIAKVRLTQGKFRRELLNRSESCEVCGLKYKDLLIASHIVPWTLSTDEQKADSDNGLVLCAMHDKLFDRKLISFNEEGTLLVSNRIREDDYSNLNLTPFVRLKMNEKQHANMIHHRKSFREIDKSF